MSKVEKIREALGVLNTLCVSLTDLEAFSLVESFDYAPEDVDAAYEAVTESVEALWDNDESLFAWNVNRDRIYDALVEKGLYSEEEDED